MHVFRIYYSSWAFLVNNIVNQYTNLRFCKVLVLLTNSWRVTSNQWMLPRLDYFSFLVWKFDWELYFILNKLTYSEHRAKLQLYHPLYHQFYYQLYYQFINFINFINNYYWAIAISQMPKCQLTNLRTGYANNVYIITPAYHPNYPLD